jgi:DNA-directed RNA polymerase subunit RPC12/RpoP
LHRGNHLNNPIWDVKRKRKVPLHTTATQILTKDDVARLNYAEIGEIIKNALDYDEYQYQKDNGILIKEEYRAEGLHKILYKCPNCKTEHKMASSGTEIFCEECGKRYVWQENGYIKAVDGETEFDHIPNWYKWERECVKEEILNGTYKLDTDVDILIARDTKKLYRVGSGHLVHTIDGFVLDGCDGELHYEHKPLCSHSLYADYNWYELGDIICIGNSDCMYYCFPKCEGDVVAKARLATEEIYKIRMKEKNTANN